MEVTFCLQLKIVRGATFGDQTGPLSAQMSDRGVLGDNDVLTAL